MSGWENLFIAEAPTSAALTGLIFVGVSINLTWILALIILYPTSDIIATMDNRST